MTDKPETADKKTSPMPPVAIDLRDPVLAAVLAWLIPGAGHFYQRRYAKAILFFVCILGTYFFGLFLGEGRVVFASQSNLQGNFWHRCRIVFQSGVGVSAAPAYVQRIVVSRGGEPLWKGFMAPPKDDTELAQITEHLAGRYDMGILYTVVAGLLNVLAIYDAGAGPVFTDLNDEKKPPPDSDKKAPDKTEGPKP